MKFGLFLSLLYLVSLGLTISTLIAGPIPSVSANINQVTQDPLAVGVHAATLTEVTISYSVAGHGPILVVVSPQWGIGSTYLMRGLSRLEEHFKVVYVDTRGSGFSSRPQNEASMSTSVMIDDLEQLRQYWNLPKLDILGHSGGGAIVLGFAERYPDRARKIVMVDAEVTDLYPSPDTDRIIDEWKHEPEHASWTIHLNDKIHDDETFTQNLRDTLGLYLYRPSKTAGAFAATLPTGVSYWAAANWEKDDKLTPMPQSHELDKVKAHSLIIVGRYDFVCPVGMSERVHEGIRGSQLAIFERSCHIPWIEEPQKFFALVTRFLSSREGAE